MQKEQTPKFKLLIEQQDFRSVSPQKKQVVADCRDFSPAKPNDAVV